MTMFTIQEVSVDSVDNGFNVLTDLQHYPATDITITTTATTAGSAVVNATAFASGASVSDVCVLIGMTVTGPSGYTGTIQNCVPYPVAGGGPNIGSITLSSAPPAGSTTFHAHVTGIFLPHPCPRMTVIGTTGCSTLSNMSGMPPDTPFKAYFKKTYEGITNGAGIAQQMALIGKLIYCRIDVWNPYAPGGGAGALIIHMTGWKRDNVGNLYPTYVTQSIDLKTAGSRTITAAGGTGLGGDVFVACPFFLSGGHAVICTLTGSEPPDQVATFTITAQAYQSIEGSALVTQSLGTMSDTISQVV
jgi:hypothetical protein